MILKRACRRPTLLLLLTTTKGLLISILRAEHTKEW